ADGPATGSGRGAVSASPDGRGAAARSETVGHAGGHRVRPARRPARPGGAGRRTAYPRDQRPREASRCGHGGPELNGERPYRGSAPPRAGAGPEPDGWIRWGRGATTAGAGSLLGERLHDPLEHGLVAAGLALRDVQDQGETLVADDDPVD